MHTEKLYYDYNLAVPFAARIVEVRPLEGEQAALVLDKTIFYPEGGGQSGDRGRINNFPVTDVREQAGAILHIVSLAGGGQPVPGAAELVLDAARRRDFTVQHTAQHLLSGTILRLTGKHTVSMHLGEETNTIDVDAPELAADMLREAEDAVMDAIERNHPVIVHRCPPEDIAAFPLRKTPPAGEEVIRVMEIAGNDFSPCCGTHCTATGQIGMLRILGAEKYKGMTRVVFIAGRRVLRHSRMLHNNAALVSRGLKVPLEETGAAALALLEKTGGLERRVKELEDAAAETAAAALLEKAGLRSGVPANGAVVIETFPNSDIAELLRIGRAAQKNTGAVLILASGKDRQFAAFSSVKGNDIRPLIQPAFAKAGGTGGGGPSFFQGVFSSPVELSVFLAEVKTNAAAFAASGAGVEPS